MLNHLSINQKALKINLDTNIYGTFAEIGAGQEVVGNFFKAGGASGTVAKSISAYDMVISDSIYGKEDSGRYVCESRLKKMLNYEYDLVIERLSTVKNSCRFFSFANTVSARNYHGTNLAHGWLGIRYMYECGQMASDIIVHVKLHDNTNILQQKAIGVLGVNMLYACYYREKGEENLVNMLMEDLSRSRIEIDMIKVKGPAFNDIDNRLLNLQLVQKDFTDAVLFGTDGEVELASDVLYKKNLLVARGSYRPPTKVNIDMIKTGVANFAKASSIKAQDVVSLAEITLANLKSEGNMSHDDFLARVDLLASINQKVLITNFAQYFRLNSFLSSFKAPNIAIVLGAYNFLQIFDNNYNQIPGGKLEALGQLFTANVKIFLYPYREARAQDELISLKNIPIAKKDQHLLDHVKSMGQIFDIEGFDDKLLHIYSRKVLNMIKENEKGWEDMVPAEIAKTVKAKCLFETCVID